MKQSLFLKLFLLCAMVASWGQADDYQSIGCSLPITALSRPGGLPSSWRLLPEVEDCKTLDQFESFLNNVWFERELGSQQKVLASVAYVHGKRLFDSLIKVVRAYDQQVVAWGNAREHSIYYRLKQGPWRWFSKKAVVREIDGYITLLKGRRGMYAGQLGNLNAALNKIREAFVGASEEELVDSLKQLICLVHSIVSDSDDCCLDDETETVVLKNYIIQNIRKSVNYERSARHSMSELGLPGYFRRNFMLYSLGVLGATAVGVYLYCNWDKLPVWKEKVVGQVTRIWNDHLKNKFKRLKNVFWSDEKEKNKLADFHREIKQKNEQEQLLIGRNINAIAKSAYPDKAEQQLKATIDDARQKNNLPGFLDQCGKIHDKRLNQRFEKELNGIEVNGTGNIERVKKVLGVDAIETAKNFTRRLPSFLRLVQQYALKQKDILVTAGHLKVEPISRGIEVMSEKLLKVERDHIRNNELSSAVLATVPLLGGAYFVYRWLTSKKKWFRKVKDALVRIRVIMDSSGSDPMSESERQGMLIYALSDLEQHIKGLPKHEQQQFEADIAFLKSRAYDDQKVQRIDSMLGPYAFLRG